MDVASRTPTSQTQQDSASPYVGYITEPNGRGTVGLVTSCLLTLLLCVWSALHLNVPHQKCAVSTKVWRNVKWIAVGIYAPELVVFAAWRQWSSAKILFTRIHQMISTNDKDPAYFADTLTSKGRDSRDRNCARPTSWTLTHSFFASTGGFALEPRTYALDEDEIPGYFPRDCPPRLALTAQGVALLAECGVFPDVSEEEIWDKSKANNLAKGLVMVQALWMLMQVLARLVERLPVTLLEVNTVAHVLCALTMYVMWWYKPLLAEEPIVLSGDWVDPLCAYMLMCSEQSGEMQGEAILTETIVKKLFVALNVYSKTPEIQEVCLRTKAHGPGQDVWLSIPTLSGAEDAQIDSTLLRKHVYMRQSSLCPQEQLHEKQLETKSAGTAFFERRPRLASRVYKTGEDAARQKQRFHLAAAAIAKYPPLRLRSRIHFDHPFEGRSRSNFPRHEHCFHPKPVEYLAASISNWPYDDLLRDVDGLTVGIVLWACNLIYGAIHAAAWNDHFPTSAEQWLWRICCLYISFCGGLWTILNTMAAKFPRLNKFWNEWMDGREGWLWSASLGFLVFLCGSSFAASRVYLVLEAFISIRSLPVQAYATPAWSDFMPHF